MMGTPFILGPDEHDALVKLREQAAKCPINMEGLLKKVQDPKGKRLHMRQMTQQTVELPFGYAVTFSIEINHPNKAVARHLSMSSPNKDRVPIPEAVWMVAEVLGFVGLGSDATENLKRCDAVWPEKLQGHGMAINVVQVISRE